MRGDDNLDKRMAAGAILGWLGFGRDEREDSGGAGEARAGQVRQARRQLLADIGNLLLENDLEVTAQNLSTVHGALAGLNPGLNRSINRRLQCGHRISQSWLDQASAKDEPGGEEAFEKLAQHLEQGIEAFSRSTQTARGIHTQYGEQLAQQVGTLEKSADQGDLINNLAGFARAMLDRSRKAEEELQRIESEAELLRHNLDRARRDAEVDFLTGLPNRRAFEQLLEREFHDAQAAAEPLCVAFCDIDMFKKVNDTHGHEAGDRIICIVAETLARISGDKCHIARHGGEEFVMLFRGIAPGEALAMLDGARENLAGRKLINRRSEQSFGLITFSGGIANAFAYDNPREALAAADDALYIAKENGRNQIRLAMPPGG